MKRPLSSSGYRLLETLKVVMNFWVWFMIATTLHGLLVLALPGCLSVQAYSAIHVALIVMGGAVFWAHRNYFERSVMWFFMLLVLNMLLATSVHSKRFECSVVKKASITFRTSEPLQPLGDHLEGQQPKRKERIVEASFVELLS